MLLFPKAHAAQHPWIRAMHRVSPALKREIRALVFLYEDALPGLLHPAANRRHDDFEEHLSQIRSRSVRSSCAYDLARPLFHYHVPDGGGPERLGDPALRDGILSGRRGAPGGGEPRRAALLEDPAAALASGS